MFCSVVLHTSGKKHQDYRRWNERTTGMNPESDAQLMGVNLWMNPRMFQSEPPDVSGSHFGGHVLGNDTTDILSFQTTHKQTPLNSDSVMLFVQQLKRKSVWRRPQMLGSKWFCPYIEHFHIMKRRPWRHTDLRSSTTPYKWTFSSILKVAAASRNRKHTCDSVCVMNLVAGHFIAWPIWNKKAGRACWSIRHHPLNRWQKRNHEWLQVRMTE